jgi:hypothetical protein
VTWSSTATAVATVSASGLITAVAAGTAIIEATSEGQSGAAVITITGTLPGGVVVSIATPVKDVVVNDILLIHAVAYSEYPISGFVASVGSHQIPLSPVGKGAWGGQMLLAGTLYGTFYVVLTATDAHNAIGIDSVEFVRKKIVLGGNGPSSGRKRLVPVIPPIRTP